MQIQPTILIIFLRMIVSEYIPHFVMHRDTLTNEIKPESSNVDLNADRTSGKDVFTWSAVFTSYHRAVIVDRNVEINTLCQTEETNNLIRSVTYFFTATKYGPNREQQTLTLSTDEKSSAKIWPLYTSETVGGKFSTVTFNQSLGASLSINFESDFDMSGFLQCQVETTFGLIMKSNLLEIIDIKKSIEALRPVASVSGGYFATNGYSVFPAVRASNKDDLNTVVKTVPVTMRWDIYMEIKTDFVKNTDMYPNMRYMKPESLGSYVIDNLGTLYINMENKDAIKLRQKIMESTGDFQDEKRLVLLMSDSTQKIGNKFHAKENIHNNTVAVQTVPTRIIPLNDVNYVVTYVGNMGDNLLCGFLFTGKNYQIIWKFNNQIKEYDSLLAEFGMEIKGAGTMLDMLKVKIEASGMWSCHLMSSNVEKFKGEFRLTVIQYPVFGEFVSTLKHFDGKPPHVIFLIDGSDLKINCSIRLTDNNNQVVSPKFFINGFTPEELCSPKVPNQALCNMQKNVILSNDLPRIMNRPSNERMIQYYVRNLQAIDKGTSKSMSHLLTCSASGTYKITNEKLNVNAYTAINVIPRPKVDDFKNLPRNCSGGSTDKSCYPGSQKFDCILKDSYLKAIRNEGVILKKYWMMGSLSQSSIESLDANAPARKYTTFSNDGSSLTIKTVYDGQHIASINKLSPVKCVIDLYYPSYIENTEMKNVEIFGDGMENPTIYSSSKNENRESGPLIYSTAKDANTEYMTAHFRLESAKITTDASAMIMGIVIAVVLVIIILVLLVLIIVRANLNKTTSYYIGQKEMDQGLDPILEFKEEQAFKEYHRKEEEPIKGSRWSMASSAVVKSQGGSVLLDEEFEMTSNYGEPVIVGDRVGNADF